jgi:RHS repeat-associated protein
VPNRHSSTGDFRYGFQGQEKDDEIKGEGNSLNYEFRMHDARVGRFFAIDPLFRKYPFYSPYSFSGNRVIDATELEGKEPKIVISDKETGYTELYVPNSFEVKRVVVKTYEATVGYVNNDGDYVVTGTFNVTRDGFIGILEIIPRILLPMLQFLLKVTEKNSMVRELPRFIYHLFTHQSTIITILTMMDHVTIRYL